VRVMLLVRILPYACRSAVGATVSERAGRCGSKDGLAVVVSEGRGGGLVLGMVKEVARHEQMLNTPEACVSLLLVLRRRSVRTTCFGLTKRTLQSSCEL
jgi:hypothetical protein